MNIILQVTYRDEHTVFARVKNARDYLTTLTREERKQITIVRFHNITNH